MQKRRSFRSWLKQFRMRPADVPVWLIGLIIAVLWAIPFLWMLSTSFKPASELMTKEIQWLPHRFVLHSYAGFFANPFVPLWILNSIVVTFVTTFLTIVFGSMAGYALARLNFPGRGVIFSLFLGSLMFPVQMYVIPLLIGFLKVGWANTYLGLILPMVPNVFAVYIFRQFFLGLPGSLEDSAAIDGAGRFVVFLRIALPLSTSAIIASTIILFNINWNNFLWPLLITFTDPMKTLTVGIAGFAPVHGAHTQLGDFFGVAMAGVTVLSLPSVAIFFILQRYFLQGVSTMGLKG